jgi:hypothetical protein
MTDPINQAFANMGDRAKLEQAMALLRQAKDITAAQAEKIAQQDRSIHGYKSVVRQQREYIQLCEDKLAQGAKDIQEQAMHWHDKFLKDGEEIERIGKERNAWRSAVRRWRIVGWLEAAIILSLSCVLANVIL